MVAFPVDCRWSLRRAGGRSFGRHLDSARWPRKSGGGDDFYPASAPTY
jgi:hypothetical protein